MTVGDFIDLLYRHPMLKHIVMEDFGDEPGESATVDMCGVVERDHCVELRLSAPACPRSKTGENCEHVWTYGLEQRQCQHCKKLEELFGHELGLR